MPTGVYIRTRAGYWKGKKFSQEHKKKNIDWVCRTCHNKRDNQGDPMGKKESSKKPNWMKPHKCKSCKTMGRQYLCANCGNPSV